MSMPLGVALSEVSILLEAAARFSAAGQMLAKAVSDALAAGQTDLTDEAVDGARAYAMDARNKLVEHLGEDPAA